MKYLYSSILCTLFCIASFYSFAQCPQDEGWSRAYFDLNQCSSNFDDGTNTDYSELIGQTTHSNNCTGISIVRGHLYRDNPEANPHSCTEGLGGTNAICVTPDSSCTYDGSSDKAVHIELIITPGSSGVGSLHSLVFYEKSPIEYSWINGASGQNNYPQKYTVRITKNGSEIYRSADNETSSDWSKEEFSFQGLPAFTVTEETRFEILLSAYCVVGNDSPISVWDIDEINVQGGCPIAPVAGNLVGGPFDFCVGDGAADQIPSGSLVIENNTGAHGQWVVTDDSGLILGLPTDIGDVNFDGAGSGTCLIHYISFEEIHGLAEGNNIADITGCYSISNTVPVYRRSSNGGTLTGGPFEFCVGDGAADQIPAGAISMSGQSGGNGTWVVTDVTGSTILGLPQNYEDVNFEGAGEGECLLWFISYDGPLSGLAVNGPVAGLSGCYSLSNPISIRRNGVNGGTLTGGPFAVCVGNGSNENLSAGDITLSGASGSNSQWVVTDEEGNLLGLPSSPTAVDFESAGVGTCLIWHMSYEDGLQGTTRGNNISDIRGCFSLSNPVEVIRSTATTSSTISGGPFAFCAGDGSADIIPNGSIALSGDNAAYGTWLITDTDGKILGMPSSPYDVNFDGAGQGTCLIWHLNHSATPLNVGIGNNVSEINGCFSFSNSIAVERIESSNIRGGSLSGGPFSFCVGDGISDFISSGDITLSGNSGAKGQWVVTDGDGSTILGLPNSYEDVDFNSAGPGTCLIWYLSYEGSLSGVAVNNPVSGIGGCFDLSNSIAVNRSRPNGAFLTGGDFSFCVGDGHADRIPAGAISVSGSEGSNNQWLVTDATGSTILGLPGNYSDVDFDGAGPGDCLLWYVSYGGQLTGLNVNGPVSGIGGCYALSNSVRVNRTETSGSRLTGGPFTFCPGDGISDRIPAGAITSSGGMGASRWVITNGSRTKILGLPNNYSDVDFDGAGYGTCWILELHYSGGISGLAVNGSVADIDGCFALSNGVQIKRSEIDGGSISGGPFSFCVGDGRADRISNGAINLSHNSGQGQWVVTDGSANIILGLPNHYSDVDFDGAPEGECLLFHLSYGGDIQGLAVNESFARISGCYDVSNFIRVSRTSIDASSISGGPFNFCVGDGSSDFIPSGAVTVTGGNGANTQWVVTDASGSTILGLPSSYEEVDFEGAGIGTCLLWHLSYNGDLSGVGVNQPVSGISGCYSLSNSIAVYRTHPAGGTLTGGPFTFCVGDGEDDFIPSGMIDLAGQEGSKTQWLVTDGNGKILGLPSSPYDVNFDGAGSGTCLIWHLSYEGGLVGIEVDANASDFSGCYSLSTPIQVIRRTGDDCSDSVACNDNGIIYFSMDACYSDVSDDSAYDYSELTADITYSPMCGDVEVIRGSVYRDVPESNPHSCTPGVNGSPAICVVPSASCDYVAGDARSVRVDIELDPASGGNLSLSNLSFFEKAPYQWDYINGGQGSNNYPELYAVRILKNGSEIYRQSDIGTSRQWTQEEFDFAGMADFEVTEKTVFSIELTAYCIIDGPGTKSVWDIDEIVITTSCGMTMKGAELNGGPFHFCVGDGEADHINSTAVYVTGDHGSQSQWVVTDHNGEILGLPSDISDVNFEGAGAGTCLVWYLSYEGSISGLDMGNNIDEVQGCVAQSNYIIVKRSESGAVCGDASANASTDLSFRVHPNPSDGLVRVQLDKAWSGTLTMNIYNNVGVLQESRLLDVKAGESKSSDLTELPSGVYHIQLLSGNESYSQKIIRL